MASAICNQLMRRVSSSSSLRSAVSRINSVSSSPTCFRINTTSFPPPPSRSADASLLRRFASSPRSAAELGGVQSLLPLHSAVAVARMTSCLSAASRSCGALSQGILCCTSPGL